MSPRFVPFVRASHRVLALSAVAFLTATTNTGAQEAGNRPAVLITGASSGIGLKITEVLAERGRRALRVHLGPDVITGLHKLQQVIVTALS